ncbi:CDP-glycerol glycerophosphotransferase family protein [Geodermatophilus sp. SYSU D00708]
MRPKLTAVAAQVRRNGGRVVRRLGLVPGGEPDGLGEDDVLRSFAPGQRVWVFFPEPPVNAYQLLQWADVLADLDARTGVLVLTQDSRTTRVLRERTSLTVRCVARTTTLDGLLRRGRAALALYVSHHPRNFQLLRFPDLAHVYLGHGESDKAVSVSNQLKAYDRAFVAGQAAVDRVAEQLLWFDAAAHLQVVGRPQVPAVRERTGGARTVLYAPTWEGAQASMAYSSVSSHGEALVGSLLDAGLRVVYRPHPRTGANQRSHRVADARVREAVAASPGSRTDTSAPLAEAFAEADVLVTDVSSVAVDWLPTGRPLVVTVPADPAAVVPPSPLLEAVPRLPAAEVAGAGALVERLLAGDDGAATRGELVRYYLGEPDPAAARERFLAACASLVDERDALVAARAGAAR